MCRALEMHGVRAQLGRILSVDHVVRGLEREALFAEGAVAVDMESAWLAEAAAGRPLCVVRVVLDAPAAEIHPLSMLKNGRRALAALRRLAPTFEIWASLMGGRTGQDPSSRVPH
jgi:4-hydroxy-3-methylbut-2-enyl diphosphate reductase